MIALAALALATGETTGPALRPVFDKPYRLTVAEERSVAGRLHHFTAERRLVFRRDSRGVIADVTLLSVTQDLGGSAGRRFEAATGALRGRTVRFHLGDDGALAAIDDEAALWAAMTAALRTASGGRGEPGSASRDPDAAMATLPSEAARATIASILMPVIAGADAARALATRGVSVPSRLIATGAPLTGTESVTLGADALLRITLHASALAAEGAVSLDRERTVDPARGLVVRQEEVQTTRLGTGVEVTRKQTILTLPVS